VARLEHEKFEWDRLVDFVGLDGLDPIVGHDIDVGLLTRRGAKQELELGESLRKIYGHQMNLTDVFVRSTRYSRTWLSARYVAQGLLGKLPDRIEVRSTDQDSLLVNEHYCPRLGDVVKESQKGSEFAQLATEMSALEALAKKHFGLRLQADDDHRDPLKGHYTPPGSAFFELADQFYCQSCHGVMNRKDIGEEFCRVSRKAWELTRRALGKNPLHSRLRVGKLIEEILMAQFESVSDRDPTSSRFAILGAHDTTLAHLNSALSIPTHAWPPYASNLVIETWKSGASEQHGFVRIFYNGQMVALPWAPSSAEGLVGLDVFAAYSRHLLQTTDECLSTA